MASTASIAASTTTGWQAQLELGFALRAGRTALVHRHQRGPLAVQRPFYPEGDTCHLYLLHPPGGLVGGDSLHIQADVSHGAHALVTTPGATKFYLSAGDTAEQVQTLRVAAGAALEWLPRENIFFPGAIAKLKTRIDLSAGARFIGWETQCLGLPVNAERFDSGHAEFKLQIEREGQPLLLERLTVTPERLCGAAGLRGLPVNATLVATPAGDAELEQVRALLAAAPNAGVTLLDDLLVVRYLGDSTEQCANLFITIWATIRTAVIGRAPCPPRIWST
jgi:urease accessory protein